MTWSPETNAAITTSSNEITKLSRNAEKIAGSIHLTPGRAYKEADNGNRSEIHWDLVLIQTPSAGGGRIWFDDELVREDGEFVVPDLAGLNPDALKTRS